MSEPEAERYEPAANDDYMSDRQLSYFRHKLIDWRNEILRGSGITLQELKNEDTRLADSSDWASAEVQRHYHLRTRDRERKLLAKIQQALERIEEGSYGYCEETGEPIGFERLDARPIATLCIEAQERHERREKEYRDA
jgi:DnaK suppressor protein